MSSVDQGNAGNKARRRVAPTRAPHAKSRRGCQTCKRRHIRCDETAPVCNNCTQRGLPCPGYHVDLRWSTKHERVRAEDGHLQPHRLQSNRENRAQDARVLQPPWTRGLPSNHPEHDTTSYMSALEDHVAVNGPAISAGEEVVAIPHSLTHLPTHLIQCWFAHICPIWSTFDSPTNYNRQIASMTWSTSAAVFHTLQHMSAAYMMHSRPELKALLPELTAQATDCVKREMSQIKASLTPTVRTDLVFAVLALGTSLHWTDCTLDASWLHDIRVLLVLWKNSLSPSQDLTYAYFSQAAVYLQMLMCLIFDDISHENLDRRRRRHETSLMALLSSNGEDMTAHPSPLPDLPPSSEGTLPNSWCGVSSEVIDIFGQVLALCRRARNREKTCTFTLHASREAICDIRVARELQEDLIALDVQMIMFLDEIFGFTPETGDAATTMTHLIHTADAYRKASLLQLYLTFDDLEIKCARETSSEGIFTSSDLASASYNDATRTQKLSELALQVVSILQDIPIDSGARSIHPILYLAVAPGLKFHEGPQASQDPFDAHRLLQGTRTTQTETPALVQPPSNNGSVNNTTVQGMLPSSVSPEDCLSLLSRSPSRIKEAREFVEARMHALRNVLPQRPLTMVMELIHAIWNHSDLAESSARDVHWMDIMMDSPLQTLFR